MFSGILALISCGWQLTSIPGGPSDVPIFICTLRD